MIFNQTESSSITNSFHLIPACENGLISAVKLLIQKDASVNEKDSNGRTALMNGKIKKDILKAFYTL